MSTEFEAKNERVIAAMAADEAFRDLSQEWFMRACEYEYSYHFTWLGRPIIQFPEDIVVLQEIIWKVAPDVIVETGIAHGGSLIFSASLLELLGGEHRRVIGVELELRPHNRAAIEEHPLFRRIELVDGSSTDTAVVEQVKQQIGPGERVLVVLDSNHTHEHVLRELELYSPLVQEGSYIVVLDTVVESMPAEIWTDRPWGPGNNPRTAVAEFLSQTDRFELDADVDRKLTLSVAPGGYLRCTR
jgi:cephalosporin hydroxylase